MSDDILKNVVEHCPKIVVGKFKHLACRNSIDAAALFGDSYSPCFDGIHFDKAGNKAFTHDVCKFLEAKGLIGKVN